MKDLPEIINTLTNEVGINLYQAVSILKSFFSGYVETERLFKICVKHKDYQAIQKQAHQLKGTAVNLRMSHISVIAGLIESATKECNIELCEDSIKNLSEQIAILESQMALYERIGKLKMLIVEDNFASGKILEQIILNFGHHSLGIVSSPEQALLSVKNELPDLVFMDIDLSTEMNGIYTAELLSRYHSVPVVFVSIHADEAIIKTAMNYGVGYVVKPFTPKEIEEMIGLASNNIVNLERDNKADQRKLKVKEDNRIFFIDLYDVIYFEARAHTILIYTSYKTYKLNTSLKNIKAIDDNDSFIQPHRSFLVNRAYISELINENYDYQLKLISLSTLIPVSQKKVKMIKGTL
jgi:two-component system response regulator LytT